MEDEREVIKCEKCGLNQFVATDLLCRKCRDSLEPTLRRKIEDKQKKALAQVQKIEARLRWARNKARQRARKRKARQAGTILGQFSALCRNGKKRQAKNLLWTQIFR